MPICSHISINLTISGLTVRSNTRECPNCAFKVVSAHPRSVLAVFLHTSVCLYVVLYYGSFWKPWSEKFIFGLWVHLRGIQVKLVYEGLLIIGSRQRSQEQKKHLMWSCVSQAWLRAWLQHCCDGCGMRTLNIADLQPAGRMCRLHIFWSTDRLRNDRVYLYCVRRSSAFDWKAVLFL